MNRRKFLGLLAAAPLAAKIPAPVVKPVYGFSPIESAYVSWKIDRKLWEAYYFKSLAENRARLGIERWGK